MRVEESIIINRKPEDVFAFFNDRANDGRWMASVIESEWTGAGEETAIGRKGRMVMKAMGRREFVDEVTAFEPGRLVAHRSVSGPMVISTACIAEPAGSGCRATVTYVAERLPGGVIGKLLEPIASRVVRKNYRGDLNRLKDILEADSC